MKNRICFVVQRYGTEVNGGAELHCRQLAEHMKKYYQHIDVLTSKAIDYMTWKDEYKADRENINGINVIRFSVEHERKMNEFNSINQLLYDGTLPRDREEEWVDKQGPALPTLINYLKEYKNEYDAFIFFTYLYYPTVMGVKEVADKAIVIPTAHDEPFLRMKIYENVFLRPKAFFYNTEEERKLINGKYNNGHIRSELGGVGVDLPKSINPVRFKEKYGLDNFLLYVGRIDEGKNCHQLFKYFEEYKKRNKSDVKLVLMGKAVIEIPRSKDIVSLGFVDDQDKFDGIAAAEILVLPSRFESLSMVVLEAMSVNTMVLVNGECEVLKGHCTKSNGALYYMNYFEFEGCLNYCLNNIEQVDMMKENARLYVDENYQWDVIVKRLRGLINYVCNEKR